jgi:hypothetical protein
MAMAEARLRETAGAFLFTLRNIASHAEMSFTARTSRAVKY